MKAILATLVGSLFIVGNVWGTDDDRVNEIDSKATAADSKAESAHGKADSAHGKADSAHGKADKNSGRIQGIEADITALGIRIDGIELAPGPAGPQGAPGEQGTPGVNCWDLNMNGSSDQFEDVNSDGVFDIQDCRGTNDLDSILERLTYLENRLQNSDLDGDGFTPLNGDCDDSEYSVSPTAQEIIDDGIDNNCDGEIDIADVDGDGFLALADGGADCDDYDAHAYPGSGWWSFDGQEAVSGGYDFNCDGTETKLFPVRCVDSLESGCWYGSDAVVPECGLEAPQFNGPDCSTEPFFCSVETGQQICN